MSRLMADVDESRNALVNTQGSGIQMNAGIKPPQRNQKGDEKPKIAAAHFGIMQRDISKMDTPTVFTDKQQVKTARSNMEDYMETFGIDFPIPALFVKDAVIYPVEPRYSIQLIKYAFPISDQYSVSTHNLDGSSSIGTFSELFATYTRGLVLRLLKRDQSSLNKIGEVALNAQEALMEFHHDGEMFAFFFKETQVLKVTYIEEIDNFVDMLKTLEDSGHDDQYFVDYNGPANNQDLSFIEKIKFDMGKKFLIGWGGTKVFIMNMELNIGEVKDINERLYHSIYHCNIISSEADGDYNYTCYVACQRNEVKQIVVFDLDEELKIREKFKTKYHGQKLKSMMTLNYLEDLNPDFKLMVSHDNKQVVFTNGEENSVLEVMDGGKYYNQRKLKHLKKKQVRFIQQDHHEGGFYFLACQEFDKYLSVEHSNRESFDSRFNRLLEPGVLRIFDFHLNLVGQPNNEGQKKEIRVISMRDDEFILDKCNFLEIPTEPTVSVFKGSYLKCYKQINNEYVNFIYSPLRAFSVQWPYVVFSGLANFVLIVNAYDRTILRRIQVGDKDAKITINETFITETNDLFILIQEGDMQRLYHMDLDSSNQFERDEDDDSADEMFKLNLIFAYNSEKVGNRPVKQIHVRGSSAKDMEYDMNEKLQVLFLHGDDLYIWIQTYPDDENVEQELMWASKCTSALYKDRDQSVYFMHTEKDIETKKMKIQEVKRLNCLFSTYEINVIYKETGTAEKLKTLNLDPQSDKLIIFSRKTDERGANMQRKSLMKIVDYANGKLLHECEVMDPELVGRLKTGLYTLCNGHIYYNNNCIKIRYDVLDKMANQANLLTEEEVFDLYLNCFPLQPNEKIRAGTPIDSQKIHKFVYIKRDLEMNEASTITILPYLHERRVYMNRKKIAQEYFYTSIITTVEQENAYREAYQQTIKNGGKSTDIDIINLLENPSAFTKSAKRDDTDQKDFKSIICMKTTDCKFYVYTQNGVLLNRIYFKNMVDAYGHPIQTSSNGLVYILKKSKDQLDDMLAHGSTSQDQAREFCTISVVQISIFGMQHIKTINIQDAIRDTFNKQPGSLPKFMQEHQWYMSDNYDYLSKHIQYDILVNNIMGILVRVTFHVDPDDPNDMELRAPQVDNQIYYFESYQKNPGDQDPNIETATCMTRPKNLDENFIFNRRFLFIWDKREIMYYQLGKPFNDSTMKKLSFRISEDSIGTKIDDIRCGSNPINIVIIVQYNPGGEGVGSEKTIDTIVWWSMDTDQEQESFEIKDSYLVLWGSRGNPYIVTDKKIYFIGQRCSITAFDYEGAIEAFKKNTSVLSVHKGHRVDGTNHNWLIFEEYLSLPFDYMTFVIKDKIECQDDCLKGNHFDPTPYNYVFNRATSFVQGDFVTEDHDQLLMVLTELEKIGIDNLEIINYTNEVTIDGEKELNSALHRAVDNGNQRSINYLLESMSHIDVNSSANYLSIISDLLDYDQFHVYLNDLPSQTMVMESKQIFRCDEPVNDKIIRQTSVSSAFFTEDFYEKQMNENENEGSNPGKVTALRADWMINTQEGKEFMQNILGTGNLDFFKIEPIQYVVEFLFQRFKIVITFMLLPIFLFSHLAYFVLQLNNDSYSETIYELFDDPMNPDSVADLSKIAQETKSKSIMIAFVCFISWFLQFIQFLIFVYYGGLDYFKKFYSQLDVMYLISVFTTFVFMIVIFSKDEMTFSQYEWLIKTMRKVAVLGYFSLYFKMSYFLSLLDSVAPLIDIIIQIFVDIKWFMIVSAWYILMFAQCYDLIAKSQVKFDGLTEEEIDDLSYYGLPNALWYMIQTFLGDAGTDGFYLGTASQAKVLNIMFFVSTFLIITHFLNMLIAIMGNTFGERAEVQSQIMTRDHLRFVVDNYHLLPLAIRDKSSLKYIITASIPEDKEMTEEEKGAWISDKFDALEKLLMDKVNKNAEYGIDTNLMVGEILRKVNERNKQQ